MIIVTQDPIDTREAYDLMAKERSGSVVLHYAVVKENNDPARPTVAIDYRANGDVAAELAGIANDLRARFSVEDVLLIRRTARVGVGEVISLVAASSANSEDAFEACRSGIARLKKMTTIAKTELFV